MKKLLGVMLGVLTAIGGFVDIGDIVANSATGARFGMSLAWAVLLGVVGIIVFAEMAGRVAAVTKRGAFDLVRERLGARVGLVNLGASFFITLLTLIAEIGGIALSFQLVSDVNYLLWIPLAGFAVWLVIWRVKFSTLGDRVRADGPGDHRRGGRAREAAPGVGSAVASRVASRGAERRGPRRPTSITRSRCSVPR